MSLITFLAPDSTMLQRAEDAFKAKHNDISIVKGLLSEGVIIASSLADQGTEIIITRGGTASAIRNAGIPVTVVEVPITGFDIIRSVENAKQYGNCIGVVTFPAMSFGIDCLGSILGVDIRLYPIHDESEAEPRVSQAIADGVNVVIGGFITGKAAQKYNHPFELIESGVEGILQAAAEAKRIAYARDLEKEKTGLFRAVLDYAYEGIISVDSRSCVTFFNPIAQRITGIDNAEAVGKQVSQILHNLDLKRVLHRGEKDLGQILTINEIDVLCNKVPIRVNSTIVGAVITFQDVRHIQKMEAQVRRSIYAAGHVASLCFGDIIGTSDVIKQTITIAKEYSLTDSSILIVGETGSGKEVFSQSIHNYSKRRQGPFVAVNCAALPSNILESELFGYVGGAFTGANQKGKPGLLEIAHGGTIFLDEIAEMDYLTQGKLLRVLQEKKVMRLGSDRIIPVDIRVIAATNKDLKTLVSENKFRADLYYRLNVLKLKIPPLRVRKEDIIHLAKFFLNMPSPTFRRALKFSPSAAEALAQYTWPGNIRELRNIVERIIAVYRHEVIDASIIEKLLEDENLTESTPTNTRLSELEEINQALSLAKGKYVAAARILGIDRSTLWRKMKRLGLK